MSMRHNPGCGHLVRLNDFKPLIPDKAWEEIERLIADAYDGEAVCNLLIDTLPLDFPKPLMVFEFQEEDEVDDDLEQCEWYVLFWDEDLYELVEKPALKSMRQRGLAVKFHVWAKFG